VTTAPPSYKLGLNLDGTLQIDGRRIVGREQELAEIQEWLSRGESHIEDKRIIEVN
jgi:hypothetical protein